jgi:hypothetical protein
MPRVLSSRALTLGAAAAVLVAVAACGDEAPTAPRAPGNPTLAASAATEPESPELQREDALASELARALARALDKPALRNDVKRAMRAAMHREHKLELRRYFRSSDGAQVASAVRQQLAGPGDRLTQLLEALPALEVYLPVRAHRAKWRGGSELVVAAGLHEAHAPSGFRLDGTPFALDAAAAPTQPVLILTKAETDFDKPVDASLWQNVEDAGGAAIGTMVRRISSVGGTPGRRVTTSQTATVSPLLIEEPCDPTMLICEEPPAPGPAPTYPVRPPGIWLDRVDVNNYEEPWYRGTAEIQLVLTGPGMNGFDGPRLSCSGQYARTQAQHHRDWKYFDQSGHTWERKPELLEGLLFGEDDIAEFGATYQDNVPINVEMWEDDGPAENCNFDGGALTGEEAFINDVRNAYGVASQIVRIFRQPLFAPPQIALAISLAASIRSLFNSGSDIMLGRAINVRLSDGTYSQREFRLVRPRYRYVFYTRVYAGLEDNGRILVTIIQPPGP